MTLYKYHKCNEYLLFLLANTQLYLASPLEQNDPFDTRFTLYSPHPLNDFYGYFSRVFKNSVIPIDLHSFIRTLINEKCIEMDKAGAYSFTEKYADESRSSFDLFRITCFTGNFESILMWSHYAGSHEGVCLGFRCKENGKSLSLPIAIDRKNEAGEMARISPTCLLSKIKYSSTGAIPVVDLINENFEAAIKEMIGTKSRDWVYEDEYRLLVNKSQFGLNDRFFASFDPTSLTKIIFGARIREDYKKMILQILKTTYRNIEVYQAKLSEKYFRLDILPIQQYQ